MKKINFGEAIIILVLMLAILGTGVIGFGLSPQVPVLFVVALLIAWAKVKKATWEKVHDGITEGITTAIIPIFIFLLIGTLIAVWIKAGIIPSLMVFGFNSFCALGLYRLFVGRVIDRKWFYYDLNGRDRDLRNGHDNGLRSSFSSGCDLIRCDLWR